MELFLHVYIAEDFPPYKSRIWESIKHQLDGIQYFDIDNHSDALVINTAITAVEEADKVFVYIESEDLAPGQLLSLMKHLAKYEKSNPLMIYFQGKNTLMQKLEKGFSKPWLRDDVQLQSAAKEFFTS